MGAFTACWLPFFLLALVKPSIAAFFAWTYCNHRMFDVSFR